MTGSRGFDLRPFQVRVPESDLIDLRRRLDATRWPEPSPASGWDQGIDHDLVRDLCRSWRLHYDWRAAESRLNEWPQFMVTAGGTELHVVHVRSEKAGALPLILTHGWPGSVLEWIGLVEPLAAEFDVVIPSLPGYGFSAKPTQPGWGIERIADTWAELMSGLGYERYGAAGSDWGTSISTLLAARHPAHVAGIHLIPPLAGPLDDDVLTEAEQAALDAMQSRARNASAYSEIHRTAPQTIGYALLDSPAGLCAWMAEKLLSWGDLTEDQVLDQVTLYWLTGTAASSARLYAESITEVSAWMTNAATAAQVPVPVGASIFRNELPRPSRRQATRRFPDIRHWSEHPTGGHFPALEAPDLLVADLQSFFRQLT